MRRWKPYIVLTLALAIGALGCGGGGGSASTVILQIAASAGSVIVNHTDQINSQVTGSTDTVVTWTVTCATGVTAGTCGAIDANGLYTAPATIPTTTSSGTTTPAPTVTITGTAHADTTKTQTITIRIVTNISISISPTTATVGTGEKFDKFAATLTNPGCNPATDKQCLAVTWSVPTSTTTPNPNGTITDTGIDTNGVDHALYQAPTAVPAAPITVTATSVKDPTINITALVTIVTAKDPTVTSVSPRVAGLGSLFQDIYVTGADFISTDSVSINGNAPDSFSVASSSVIRARLLGSALATAGVLQVGVSRQGGAVQNCPASDPTQCQIVVTGVRPAVSGPSPDNMPQGSAGARSFNVNGGFYGTTNLPTVHATYDGDAQIRTATVNNSRQISVMIGDIPAPPTIPPTPPTFNPADFSTPGLHQVAIRSDSDPTKFAATNLAIQPVFGSSLSAISPDPGSPVPVGTTPSDVAINPATGRVIVANTGSDNVTVFDLATPASKVSICTAAIGQTSCAPSGPSSVAVDSVLNLALVANAKSNSIAVVDLGAGTPPAPMVTAVIPTQDPPVAVAVNPVSGRALVTMNLKNSNTHNYGLLIDLTLPTPAVTGVVTISTGGTSRVAVEPHLNWAVATPGGLGSLNVVDLGRQTTNQITSVSRSLGAVTVQISTTSDQPLLAIQVGDAVLIQGVTDSSFTGVYNVASVGPGNAQFTYTQPNDANHLDKPSFNTTGTASYSQPIATRTLGNSIQGIGINPVTQQAVLTNPSASGGVLFFNLLDLSSSVLPAPPSGSTFSLLGNVAGAFNELTNVAVVVNSSPNLTKNQLAVIDPSTPGVLTTFDTGNTPVAVAIDPGSNTAVVANQGDNTVSILNLGTIQSFSITETSPKMFVTTSTLSSAPAPAALTLTVIGKGFTPSSQVRLDGVQPGGTTFVSDRKLTVVVPPSLLSSARRFAVDVQDTISGIVTVTNVSDFTVVQSVDVAANTQCTAAPLPSGVAIDPQQNIAVVSLFGCNTVALIDLSSGTGRTVAVGSNPLGVAVLPRLHKAVVANNGISNNASVVDELAASVTSTIATGAAPVGVAADQDTGEAAVANSGANTVTVFNVATGSIATIQNVQRPTAVAFNYRTHQVGVAASSSNSVGIASGSGGSVTTNFPGINVPTSVVYDPVPGDCFSDADGCFLANSSTGNALYVLDPATQQQTFFSIGINPTAIAFNYLTSTLISTNTASHTVTVVDFLGKRIRAVLSLPPQLNVTPAVAGQLALTGALQFAVDIHPLTNLAVIADTANGRVLLVPVPR
jgi:DNA-binding beta-propeller fold protein YncE